MRASIIGAAFAAFSASLTSALCLDSAEANLLATEFGLLISNYSNDLANKVLYPSFQDYSESVNTLINSGGTSPQPLLGPTFTSLAGFESASAAQPSVPFTVLNVWYTCNVITVRWESDQSPEPVRGISVLHTVDTSTLFNLEAHQIDEVWAEFDSGAWLVNLGVLQPPTKKRAVEFKA